MFLSTRLNKLHKIKISEVKPALQSIKDEYKIREQSI